MTTTASGTVPIVAPEDERATIASIEDYLGSKPGRVFRLAGPSKKGVPIPSSLRRVLVAAARQLADGNGVSMMPVTAEVTTQRAAELLNVSRPFVVGLLDKGEIPFHKVGTHRRIRLKDLLASKRRRDRSRRAVRPADGGGARAGDLRRMMLGLQRPLGRQRPSPADPPRPSASFGRARRVPPAPERENLEETVERILVPDHGAKTMRILRRNCLSTLPSRAKGFQTVPQVSREVRAAVIGRCHCETRWFMDGASTSSGSIEITLSSILEPLYSLDYHAGHDWAGSEPSRPV